MDKHFQLAVEDSSSCCLVVVGVPFEAKGRQHLLESSRLDAEAQDVARAVEIANWQTLTLVLFDFVEF